MKIDPRSPATSAGTTPAGPSQVNQAAQSPPAGGSKRGAAVSEGSASGDTVELSSPLRVLQTIASGRANRIEQLTQSVRGGTYSADPRKVSKALVQETLAGAAH